MKINPTELRIGNIVKYANESYNIVELYKNRITIEGIERQNYNICYSEISGFTITKEWLIKFGFKEILEEGNFELETTHFNMTHFNNEFFISFGKYSERDIINHIKFVHQLQNLFYSLTNKELFEPC